MLLACTPATGEMVVEEPWIERAVLHDLIPWNYASEEIERRERGSTEKREKKREKMRERESERGRERERRREGKEREREREKEAHKKKGGNGERPNASHTARR